MTTRSFCHKAFSFLFILSLVGSGQAVAEGTGLRGDRELLKRTVIAPGGPTTQPVAYPAAGTDQTIRENFGGREMVVFIPRKLPAEGHRALVIALHGGGGNADQFSNDLRMEAVASQHGFIVAYLNGTPVSFALPKQMHGWNAGGGCCGEPAKNNVNDVQYITSAATYLAGKYGVNKRRTFVLGYSNGAMMSNLLMCNTNTFAAAVPFAGTLNVDVKGCPSARGASILAIHGTADANVPIDGGVGPKSHTDIDWNSEAYTHDVFLASGANHSLNALPGVDHPILNIDSYLSEKTGKGAALTAATFFGLAR